MARARVNRLVSQVCVLSAFHILGAGWARAQAPAPVVTTPKDAKAAAAEAKQHLERAAAALKAGNRGEAIRAFQASNEAQRSDKALLGLAGAYFEGNQLGEAYRTYSDVLTTYGAKLPPKDKKLAETRLAELRTRTGDLSIRVNEVGAQVLVDEVVIGTTPISPLLRVAVGKHRVQVAKEGFAPFDAGSEVKANDRTVVEVTLERESRMARLSVKEKTGQSLRVMVDNIDVGATPWQGEVEPGRHEVSGRSQTLSAPPQTIEVAKGKTAEVELVAAASSARLEVRTSDGIGEVSIDGKVSPTPGSFAGEVAPGAHLVVVTRPGYDRFEKRIELAERQTVAEMVTLKQTGVSVTEANAEEARSYRGIYGGVALAGAFVPGGSGNELEFRCTQLGAESCETPSPVGGGLMGFVGYSWNPVGLELVLAGLGDVASQKATMTGKVGPNVNPALGKPAREETFLFVRAGGSAAIRARVQIQTEAFRVALAGGFGASYKVLNMTRDVEATDGSGLRSVPYVQTGVTYFSPAVTGDLSVQLRVSSTMAIALGTSLWIENAGSDVRAPGDSTQVLASSNQLPVPLDTPNYNLATGTQFFLTPYVGLQFGP
jgi:hypothetical protein